MKLQHTLLTALLASAAAMAFQTAVAAPVFKTGANVPGDTSLNDMELINRENVYRLTTDCLVGECLAHDAVNDPTGYSRVITGATAELKRNDLFVGVLQSRQIRNIDTGATWDTDSVPPSIDEFTGYFVQEVKDIEGPGPQFRKILLGGLSVADPFGVLDVDGADNTFGTVDDISTGYWVDQGVQGVSATRIRLDGLGLTTWQSIASATDGSLWAYMGIGTDNSGTAAAPSIEVDGYAWSQFDNTAATFTGNFFVAYDVVSTGPAFTLAGLRSINDPAESIIGGTLVGDPVTTALNNYFGTCAATATYACNDIVGNGQLSANQSVLSPWVFASEDPLQLNAIPEPATLGLLGLGLLGLSATLRRRAK